MRRWLRPRYLAGLLLFSILVAVAAVRSFPGRSVQGVAVIEGPLVQTVIASGRIVTPAHIQLGAVLTATVTEVTVDEGDRVQPGQTLIRLADAQQRAALAQAAQSLREAEMRLRQLAQVGRPVAELTLAQTEANLRQASAEYARAMRLFEEGFYDQSRLDEARRVLDNARAAHAAAKTQLAAYEVGGVETQLARTRRDEARAALALARARLSDTVIRAPVAGIVLRRHVEPGDVVTAGRVLLELAAAGETQVELQVDENNLALIRPGQRARILADAYPAHPFPAEVTTIAPGVDARKGAVAVKLRVSHVPGFVKPDMTVTAEIEVGRRARALRLPARAIHDAAERPWVLVVEQGRAVRREVRLGLRGQGWVEVVQGLRSGERVIPPATGVKAGERVRLMTG